VIALSSTLSFFKVKKDFKRNSKGYKP